MYFPTGKKILNFILSFYSPEGRRNSYKTAYVSGRAHKVQLKVSIFNWIVVVLVPLPCHTQPPKELYGHLP